MLAMKLKPAITAPWYNIDNIKIIDILYGSDSKIVLKNRKNIVPKIAWDINNFNEDIDSLFFARKTVLTPSKNPDIRHKVFPIKYEEFPIESK